MLRFLRTIRKKLVEQDKVRSYILYAIGEIALVMIGILLALQVNNWNEERKQKKQKAILLESLKTEFEENQNRLNILLDFIANREKYARTLLAMLEQLPSQVDSVETVFALERAGFVHYFNPTLPTYEEMKSSGTLSLIENKDLKRRMADYQTFLEYSYRIEDGNKEPIQQYSERILKYMDPDFGDVNITDNESRKYASVKFDLEAMSNDPEIQYLLKIIIQKSVLEAGYKDRIFRPRLNYILELIEEEKKISLND
ncbi:hypothetical protein E4S40_15420 [Algoriphagus kandeliae]|uniref:Uncharacterized protein n=1 Tax=Algoriphagus kandeliae TaxID=2562278 RepID=A0A4Y9QLQ2_9BACT|nr:DUF6090 family protein [Algoriphagus kandeliae]TFV93631.1 hypothetical protein E4S40_15420 [Algoriphagus kandeliae]